MGLLPNDWLEFDSDDYSTFVNRLVRDTVSGIRAVNEAAPEYDTSRYVVAISTSAEIALPPALFDGLMLEIGSIVGFFRDSVGYRFIPIHNPTRYGPQTVSVDEGGIQIVENAIMEYSVAVTKELRRAIAYGWQDELRLAEDEPFSEINEPAPGEEILRNLTKDDPAFRH